jgi:hypothetical protein
MYHIYYKLKNTTYILIKPSKNISSHTRPTFTILLKYNTKYISKNLISLIEYFTLLLSFALTSEKSIPFFGNGTKPGSEYAARPCENIERKTNVQTIKAFNVPYKLEIRLEK